MDVESETAHPDAGPDAAWRRPGPGRPRPLSVVQVVRSNAFAGVERYMCQVSNGLASRGHHLTVIGGDPARMHAELSGRIEYLPADNGPPAPPGPWPAVARSTSSTST